MNQNKPSNTLAIIGLVLAIIAILFSFIPCLGTLAFIPGIIGLILSVIAFLKAKDNGDPKGMAIGGIVVSILACAISAFQIYAIGNMASGGKEYTDCVELETDYKATEQEIKTLTKEMENDNASFSSITKITKLGIKIAHYRQQATNLDCDIIIEDFNPGSIEGGGESEIEEDGHAEGESGSNEEEQGN